MVRRWLLAAVVGLGFLAACGQPALTASPAPTATPPAPPTATPTELILPEPPPALDPAPEDRPVLAAAAVTAESERVPALAVEGSLPVLAEFVDASDASEPELSPPFQICSPLEGIPLDELRLVTSASYAPPPGIHSDQRHQGIDFSFYQKYDRATIEGLPVQTVLPGRVAASIANSFPFGNLLIVETPPDLLPAWLHEKLSLAEGHSLYILFAHLKDAVSLQVGDPVTACQVVSAVGKTGNAGQCHLHLETRLGPSGAVFPVMGYYTPEATPEERETYLRWRTSGEFSHFNPLHLLLAEAPIPSTSP